LLSTDGYEVIAVAFSGEPSDRLTQSPKIKRQTVPAALFRTQDRARGIEGAGNEVIAVAWRAKCLRINVAKKVMAEEGDGEPPVVCRVAIIGLTRCGRFALGQIRADISGKETG
jgi:hypothetical protein